MYEGKSGKHKVKDVYMLLTFLVSVLSKQASTSSMTTIATLLSLNRPISTILYIYVCHRG